MLAVRARTRPLPHRLAQHVLHRLLPGREVETGPIECFTAMKSPLARLANAGLRQCNQSVSNSFLNSGLEVCLSCNVAAAKEALSVHVLLKALVTLALRRGGDCDVAERDQTHLAWRVR